jgi:biotin transport system ATP-binding protein
MANRSEPLPQSDRLSAIEFNQVTFGWAGQSSGFGPVSLSISDRRVGVVGQNGSGKSTFARLLNGLLTPASGRVTVAGIDVNTDRRAATATVGMIFQNPDHQIIFPTVQEEIAFGLEQQGRSKREARAMALALLAQHGRAHWAERATIALSQGQRHLLCLLSILVMQPKVLVLDEPYAGLDIPTSRQLHRWLDRLEQTVVLVTHDPTVLAGFDRVIWLDEGRIRRDGAAGEVLAAFAAEMDRKGALDAGTDTAS